MKARFLFIIAAAAATSFSCSKESMTGNPDAGTDDMICITVSQGATRTTLADGVRVLWSGADRIKVFSNSSTSGSAFSLKSGSGSECATFQGSSVSGTTFYATYPETAVFDGNTFTYTLPSEFDYLPGSFAEGTNPMLATSSTIDSFAMKNLCGVLRLQLKGGSPVSRLVFTFSDPVSGQATVARDGSELSMASGASRSITMNCQTPLSLSEESATNIFLVVPTGTYSSIEIKAFNSAGNYSRSVIATPVTICRSAKTTVSASLPAMETRPTFTTCSFNIYSQGMDDKSEDSQKWGVRKAGVYAFLKDQDFDVFCTQECEYRQRVNILGNVPGYSAYGKGCWLGNESSSGGKYDLDLWEYVYNNEDAGNVVFYKTDMFNVLDKGTFWLTEDTPSSPAKYSKSEHYHTCSWMKLEYKSNGYKFYVFNTHLENGYNDDGDATRAYEMPILYNKVNSINSEHLPMTVYGDFNGSTTDLWGYCPACQTGWYWARNQDGKTSKDDYPTSLNNFKAWPDYKGSNVDHIAYKYFYDGSAGGKHGLVAGSFETFNQSWAGVGFISDHWPIKATLVFDFQ